MHYELAVCDREQWLEGEVGIATGQSLVKMVRPASVGCGVSVLRSHHYDTCCCFVLFCIVIVSIDYPYRIHFERPDERVLASIMLDIASKEFGETWQNCTYVDTPHKEQLSSSSQSRSLSWRQALCMWCAALQIELLAAVQFKPAFCQRGRTYCTHHGRSYTHCDLFAGICTTSHGRLSKCRWHGGPAVQRKYCRG